MFGCVEERVTRRDVAEYWAKRESRKKSRSVDTSNATYPELVTLIEDIGPTRASRVLWAEQPVRWYKVTLDEGSFSCLSVHKTIDGTPWADTAPNRRIMSAGRRFLDGRVSGDEVTEDTVESYLDNYSDGGHVSPLVLFMQEHHYSPWVVDGNHRATAIAAHLQTGGPYEPVEAYLGISYTPVQRFWLGKLRQASRFLNELVFERGSR